MIGDAYHAQINDFAYTYEDVTHVVYSTDPYQELRLTHYDSEHLPIINAIWLQEGCGWHGYIEFDDSEGQRPYKQLAIKRSGHTPQDALQILLDQLNKDRVGEPLRDQGSRFTMRCLGALQQFDRVMRLLDNPYESNPQPSKGYTPRTQL